MSPIDLRPLSAPRSRLLCLPIELRLRTLSILAHNKQFHSLASLAGSCQALYHSVIPFIYLDVHLDSVESVGALARALQVDRRPSFMRSEGIDATDVKTLRDNFRMTKKITLGDIPSHADWIQLTLALGNGRGRRGTEILFGPVNLLCPNVTLLQFAPLHPYLTPPDYTRKSSDRKKYSVVIIPYFLQLCLPRQICYYDIYGPQAELRSHLMSSCNPFFDFLEFYLKVARWPAEGMDVSWHGPLFKRYGDESRHSSYSQGITFGLADRVRVYV